MAAHGLRRSRLAAVGAVTCLAAAYLPLALPAAAQEARERPRYIAVDSHSAALGIEPLDVTAVMREAQSRFQLFGEGDRAWTSLRMLGDNLIYESNTGPGEDWWLWTCPIFQFSTSEGSIFQTWGWPVMVGVPRGEWVQYLEDGAESLRNARGDPPGYSVLFNAEIVGRTKDLNAADGLVGTLLTGERSTDDGTCLDHTAGRGGAWMPAGYQLLPLSNCRDTWSYGGTTWLGDRPVSPDTWIELFNEQGADFQWDRWRVPADRKDQTKFMGNNVATYGHYNDYNSTVLRKWGNVVPGGSGDPQRSGYPLGLDWYFDAFTFTIPTVVNAKFWSVLIVNNSRAVYGVPHDYDSLYINIGGWPGREQDGATYFIPEKGAWVSAESHNPGTPNCARTEDIPLIGNDCGGCYPGCTYGTLAQGHGVGGHGYIILKSPIGDLRNKLFTTEGSPFYLPSHPLAGDTITYNHSRNWNYGVWMTVFNQATDRARFGVMSSTTDNTLDGTACGDWYSLGYRFRTFQSNDWPENQCDYKAWVPGDWQYVSGRPLGAHDGPDTLHLAGCGPNGCPDAWSDTTWQGWAEGGVNNFSGFGLGPFRLEADSTTELFIAAYSGRDSVSFEAFTQGIYDFYLGLFQGPEAPPRVTIRDLAIGAGVSGGSEDEAAVTLVWDDAAEDFEDPFMAKFADDMEAAAVGTELATIRDNNAGIVERIRERANDNLERLLVFRSCDGGSTFSGDDDCVGDEAVDADGNPVEPGWQFYASLPADASGDFPNTFSDENVTAGVSYLYVILGQSRGFEELVINDPNATVDGLGNFTCGPNPCQTTNLVVAPPILNPLSASPAEPNVVSVYIPTSVAAGGQAARANFVLDTLTFNGMTVESRDLGGSSTVPFDLILTSADIRENNFEVVFGNYIEITEVSNATTEEIYSVSVVLEDLATTVVGDTGTTTQTTPLQTRTFTRTDGVPVTLNAASLASETTVDDTVTRVYAIGPGDLDPDARTAIGFVLYETVGAENLPLLASGRLTGNEATPGGFLANPAFPGFLVSADNSAARSLDEEFYMADGDTLSSELDPTLNYDERVSALESVQSKTFGEYVIQFSDSVFGTGSPFLLALTDPLFDPAEVDAAFDASLLTRTRGTTAVTDPDAKLVVAAATGRDPGSFELVAANLPFEIINLTHGRTAEVAMLHRGEVYKQLGRYADTVSVTVDADQWIPEDPVYVIEQIDVYRTRDVGGVDAIVVDEAGTPQTETRRAVSFAPLVLTCGLPNTSCNPVHPDGAGFGSWIGVEPGDNLHVKVFSPFDNASRFQFSPTQPIAGEAVLEAGRSIAAQMDSIGVVPNPYIFFSQYEAEPADRRIMFTNLPPDGEIRIYTVAGNFVQEIDWTPAQLMGNGDLFWDLQTREGNEIGAGLYLFVVTATDPSTNRELKKMGKFVVIR